MIRRLLISWACNVAALFVASIFVDGIEYGSDFWVLILAGLVFGLVNFFLKPIVKLIALPAIIVTFGLALFGINILMLYVTSWIVPEFTIEGFLNALWATLIIWAANMVLDQNFSADERGRRNASS